jgi:RNA polymerase sigma-70 factor, ECF subfamily
MDGLNKKEKELVALGAAIAANCIPCVAFHIEEAKKIGLSITQIEEAVALAKKIKDVPANSVLTTALAHLSSNAESQITDSNSTPCGCSCWQTVTEKQGAFLMNEEENYSFEDVANALGAQLSAYLRRMVNHSPDADDLLQETLIRIAGNLSDFNHRSSLKTWAYTIATNVAYDYLRKNKKVNLKTFDENDHYSDAREDERLVLDEMNTCVREVIDTMPPDYRAVIVLFNLQGKSAAEISEICGISIETTKIRIHRAKKRLKEALNRQCIFYTTPEGSVRCDRKRRHCDWIALIFPLLPATWQTP